MNLGRNSDLFPKKFEEIKSAEIFEMICSLIFKKKTRGVQEGRIKKYPTIPKISSGFKEASPGFEPGIRVLQTRALPLGYDAEKKLF